jgi:hypothetical protein
MFSLSQVALSFVACAQDKIAVCRLVLCGLISLFVILNHKQSSLSMKPKTINILYWVFTIIFGGLMVFSSVGGIGPNEQTIEIFHKFLGYPIYFIQLISWAKIIGVVALLIPTNKTIKEWAYAGLFFDLAAAVYSGIAASGKFDPQMLGMLMWIIPGVLSYYFWKKKVTL